MIKEIMLISVLVLGGCKSMCYPSATSPQSDIPDGSDNGRRQVELVNFPVLCEAPSRAYVVGVCGQGAARLAFASGALSRAERPPAEPVVELLQASGRGWENPMVVWRVLVAGIDNYSSITSIGDINADGYTDLFVAGIYREQPAENVSGGWSEIWSGIDGQVLHSVLVESAGVNFGYSAVRVTLARSSDRLLIIGDPGAADGAGGALLAVDLGVGDEAKVRWRAGPAGRAREFGRTLAVVDDMDSDGWPDIVCGGCGQYVADVPGSVCIISSSTGTIIREISAPAGQGGFGCSLCAIDNSTRKEKRDFIVGACGLQSADPGRLSTGKLFIYSTSGTSISREIPGEYPGDGFGASVTTTDDYSGDGIGEVIALGVPFTMDRGRGVLVVIDPTVEAPLCRLEFSMSDPLPRQVFNVGDIDGDWLCEIGIYVSRSDWLDGYGENRIVLLSGAGLRRLCTR